MNVPADYPYADFQDLYLTAWQSGDMLGATLDEGSRVVFDGPLVAFAPEAKQFVEQLALGAIAGELEADAALKTIAQTKRQVERVCRLLRGTALDDERLALSQRYQRAMSAPVDLSGGKASAELPGKLMTIYRDLMQMLQGDFLK